MIGRFGLMASCTVAAIAIGSAQLRGLTAADFIVLEDGKPQPIVGFDAVDLPDQIHPRGSWMREVAPDIVTNRFDAQRVVVILLDDFGVPFDPSAVQFSKNIARATIDQLGPADLAAVVYTFTLGHGDARRKCAFIRGQRQSAPWQPSTRAVGALARTQERKYKKLEIMGFLNFRSCVLARWPTVANAVDGCPCLRVKTSPNLHSR